MKNLSNDTKVSDLSTLTVTFLLKIANLNFVASGACVSQMNLFEFRNQHFYEI